MTGGAAYELLCSLRLDDQDGTPWGKVAHDFQREDALALLGGVPARHMWVRPRGASKTSDAAGTALSLLLTQAPAGSRSFVYAVDKDQAAIVMDALTGFVQRTPGLKSLVELSNYAVVVRASGARLTVESADGASAYGHRPWLIIADELSSWPEGGNHLRLWNALASSLGKVPGARLLVASMAGHLSHFSHKLFEEAGRSPYWRLSHTFGPTPWWTDEQVAATAADLAIVSQGEYERLILARWSELSDEALATEDDIQAAVRRSPAVLSPVEGVRYLAALDLGTRRDYSALAVGHAEGERVVVDLVRHWRPKKGRNVVLSEVESSVLNVCERYGARLLFDRHQAEQMSQNLTKAGVRTREFVFSSAGVTKLAKSLVTSLRDHRIEVPNDGELVSEFRTARLRETGTGAKLVNPAGTHDDLATVVGMLTAELGGRVRGRGEFAAPTGYLPVTTLSPLDRSPARAALAVPVPVVAVEKVPVRMDGRGRRVARYGLVKGGQIVRPGDGSGVV